MWLLGNNMITFNDNKKEIIANFIKLKKQLGINEDIDMNLFVVFFLDYCVSRSSIEEWRDVWHGMNSLFNKTT